MRDQERCPGGVGIGLLLGNNSLKTRCVGKFQNECSGSILVSIKLDPMYSQFYMLDFWLKTQAFQDIGVTESPMGHYSC